MNELKISNCCDNHKYNTLDRERYYSKYDSFTNISEDAFSDYYNSLDDSQIFLYIKNSTFHNSLLKIRKRSNVYHSIRCKSILNVLSGRTNIFRRYKISDYR